MKSTINAESAHANSSGHFNHLDLLPFLEFNQLISSLKGLAQQIRGPTTHDQTLLADYADLSGTSFDRKWVEVLLGTELLKRRRVVIKIGLVGRGFSA